MADHTLCVSSKVPYKNRKETLRPGPCEVGLFFPHTSTTDKKVYAEMRSYYSLSAESPAVIRDANGGPVEWTLLTAYPFFERINGVF